MSEFEKQKMNIANQLKNLCAHCANEISHDCKIQGLAREIVAINGVPLIVNSQFNGVFFTN